MNLDCNYSRKMHGHLAIEQDSIFQKAASSLFYPGLLTCVN